MRLVKLIVTIVGVSLLFVAAGCQNLGHHVRNYDGPPWATNQTALLKVEWSIWHVMLSVNKIDHHRAERLYASEIELLPGPHDLEVSYRDSDGYHSTVDAKISFVAESGMVYELHADPLEMNLDQKIGKSLEPFSRWQWTLWIIDAKTGKVVAGKPRETPLHWYEP